MNAASSTADLAERLMRAPTLALLTARATALLERERAARERFLDEITPSDKAEFINGEVIMHSPARAWHLDVTARLLMLMRTFAFRHDLGWVTVEKLMVSLTRNEYEPDLTFFRKEVADTFEPAQVRFPAPDFICEVLSPSTERRDRGIKLEDYAAHGVGEYWIVDPEEETVEQYVLPDAPSGGDGALAESEIPGPYALRIKAESGEIESVALRGFRVPIRALFDDGVHSETLAAILRAD